ncbi:MAG: rluB [Candidatus Saccharibacteria bacterium]|nr:rluB [Candidatus Saccharibacteria bacterium]
MDVESYSERLNKYIALRLGVSRREADSLIEHGHVKVNGERAVLGSRFKTGDSITVQGHLVPGTVPLQYLRLHKPVGYVSSRRRQGEHPTIYELLPSSYHDLKPVGRLDKDSSGVLLLSNDGDFAYQMTHPKFHKQKQYEVSLDKDLEPLHQQMIGEYGLSLEDGVSQLTLTRINETSRKDWYVTMHEGRNRQIRRTFAALGYTVVKLHRTHFGPYHIGTLAAGAYDEVDKI